MGGKNKVTRGKFDMTNELVAAINQHIVEHPLDLFHIPTIRRMITGVRAKSVDPESFEIFENYDSGVIEHTVEYNRDQLLEFAALERPRLLINPLTSIHYINENIDELKILCVGPRTESEIFMLLAAGFKPDNVHGLDLISYSDYVDVGDMHDMPYEDDSFDIVFLGWVIGYSKECQKIADETIRVTKPGGYVAVGVEREPPMKVSEPLHGVTLDGTDFETTNEILALFDGHVHSVPFRHDVHRKMQDKMCHLMVIAELN
ncbi:MAG: class I SAM-dependent methyltransferase [Rhodospirillales bacterium]|nr:class I SAM-dependent methyltransferase [Rhodospirillales bacterium]